MTEHNKDFHELPLSRLKKKEYWCEECVQQQPSPNKGIAMLYYIEKSENSYAQLDQEGYCTDEERNEIGSRRTRGFLIFSSLIIIKSAQTA
ncbi:hypothetical protein RIR_jg10797.t2 [Rhizophagus irregularis DAOM 181602=DAOM 197198]|nr:hypothetical protein RIR_jg10797.t2 [Rhizophagus irregularis DAOM 181602=DAOM 197198]